MKNYLRIVLVSCLLIIAATVQAQMKFGPVAGVNFSKMTLKYGGISIDPMMMVGFHLGGLAEIPLSDNFVLQPAIMYSTKGSRYSLDMGEADYEMSMGPNFIEVPIYFAYKFELESMILFLKAGPYGAYAVGGQGKADEEDWDLEFGEGEEKDMKPLDFGLGVGGGIEFNNLIVSVQYEFGLTNLAPVDDAEMKISVFSISIGYLFGGK